MGLKHREYSVSHSYQGFSLWVHDHPWLRWWTAQAAYWVVGPLDRGGNLFCLPYRAVNAIFKWQDAKKVEVADIPLTAAQAIAMAPYYAGETWITVDGEDEDGDVYRDGALVAVKCPDCSELVDSAGRSWVAVMGDHDC